MDRKNQPSLPNNYHNFIMGKRKSSKKLVKRTKEVLDKEFDCLLCSHEKSISIVIKDGLGTLNCKACGVNYQTTTTKLSAPVDVYSDWVDACDDLERPAVRVNEVSDEDED